MKPKNWRSKEVIFDDKKAVSDFMQFCFKDHTLNAQLLQKCLRVVEKS